MAQRRPLILLIIVLAIVATGAGLTEGLFWQAAQRPALRVQSPSPAPPNRISPVRTVLPELSASVSDAPARRDVARLNSEGMALYEIGRFGDALAKFDQAAATDATDRAVQRNLALTKARLAWVRLERGEPDAAVRAPTEAVRDLESVRVDAERARAVMHGATFAAPALLGDRDGAGPFAVVDDAGALLAVYERRGGGVKPSVVLATEATIS